MTIDGNTSQGKRVFLSAEWRYLVMLNYEVEPALLYRYVPPGTLLDSFQGKTYVSLVGFRFCHTKLLGRLPVPFHTDFDEVNLRFYVRRKEGIDERRGVVFIAEVVPRLAIATTARIVYGENYVCLPMKHRIETDGIRNTVEYQWRVDGHWCRIYAETDEPQKSPADGSLEQFITEHYWGYSTRHGNESHEYHVSHPPWKVWSPSTATFEGDASALYGPDLGGVVEQRPSSAFVAEGSPVVVFKGSRIQ
jgi:uncharacterized protein YqjF (DUF2071 family)